VNSISAIETDCISDDFMTEKGSTTGNSKFIIKIPIVKYAEWENGDSSNDDLPNVVSPTMSVRLTGSLPIMSVIPFLTLRVGEGKTCFGGLVGSG